MGCQKTKINLMDPKIINDTFEKEPHICSNCECPIGNHLIFFSCPLFSGNPICRDCCMIDMMKDDVDVKVSAKLGNPIDKKIINSICFSCGMNNACQNADLAKKLESNTLGDINGSQPEGPTKTR
jgi:hypothetical protein